MKNFRAKNQRWFSLKQCCSAPKQRWIFQFWAALIQRKSELISSETALISADVFHFIWIIAEKHQISETALFSADYLSFQPSWYTRLWILNTLTLSNLLHIFHCNTQFHPNLPDLSPLGHNNRCHYYTLQLRSV